MPPRSPASSSSDSSREQLQLADDPGQRRAAAQRQRHRFAQSRQPVLGAQPQQHHLALGEAAARGHVGLAERQRVGDDLDGGDAHSHSFSPGAAGAAQLEISSPAVTSRL